MKKNKNLVYKILLVCFSIALIVILGLMVRNAIVKKRAAEVFEQMQEDTAAVSDNDENNEPVEEETPTPTPTPEVTATPEPTPTPEPEVDVLQALNVQIPERNFDWDNLKAQNGDIYAWIYVPGTAVDYPIVQHPTDNNYYVDHNLDGSTGYPGGIFTQNYNTKNFDDPCTIVYGHNMKDGSMFHTLHSYEDPAFFEQNPYIYIYLPTGEVYVYKIFGATAFSDVHLMAQYQFEKEEDLELYISDLYNARSMAANFRAEMNVTGKAHIIVLSTCQGTGETHRYLVNGLLLNDPNVSGKEILAMCGQGE